MPKTFSVAIGPHQDPTVVHFSDPDLLSQFIHAYAQSDGFDRLEVTAGTPASFSGQDSLATIEPWYGDYPWLVRPTDPVTDEHVAVVAYWQIEDADSAPDSFEFFTDDQESSDRYIQLLEQDAFPNMTRVARLWRNAPGEPFILIGNWVA